MQKNSTIIEITNQYIKLAATKPSLKGAEIINLTVRKPASNNFEDLTKELVALTKELKFLPSPLIASFPRNLVTMRNLHLPSTDPKEIEGMIDLHMGRQAPYPREEIIGSFQIIGTDETGYSKVILAISHRDALRQVFNALNVVNLFPEKIELSSQGCLSWFLHNERPHLVTGEIYILLDIDANFTDFMIIDKDKLLFSRNIAYGADQLESSQQAQAKFISELKQSLVIFQSEEMNKKPAKIFISGSVDNIKQAIPHLKQEIDAEVEIFEPQLNFPAIPKNVSVSSILGLAVEPRGARINFILPEVQIRKALKERSRELVLLGSLLMFVFMISLGIFMERLYNRSNHLKMLNTKYQSSKEEIEGLDSMLKKIKIVRDRLDSRASTINYFYQINKLIPAEIALKIINFDVDDKISLRGQAIGMSDIFRFVTILENSNYFKDIQVKYTTKKRIADKDITEFEIVCPISKNKK
jgi:Tfp pilus assembly PilM family ATPase/Tfp pilus assembly protein PilN